jgi:hypothetical protein
VVSSFVLALLLFGVLLWALLDWRERRRATAGQPRHSPLRLVFAAAALLTLLFSGGCSLLFGFHADGQYVDWPAVLIIGGPPFVIGLLVFWLVMRRGNKPE